MGYPKTVLTYQTPSDAEVDKSLLESHGITVYLMNANVTRAEIAAVFDIQLQVPAEDVERAIAILREANPSRFGSVVNVKKIEADILRGVVRFFICTLVSALVLFVFFIQESSLGARIGVSLMNGLIGGLAYIFYIVLKPKKRIR